MTAAGAVQVRGGSPLLTIDRTLVVEIVVESVQARRRRGRPPRRTGPDRWREWQRLLDDGSYGSRAELARAVGVSRAAVTQGLRRLMLTLAADGSRGGR